MPRRGVELQAGEYYHIYNRGNNREPIFLDRENYVFFLRRVRQYLVPVLDVVAYCLICPPITTLWCCLGASHRKSPGR